MLRSNPPAHLTPQPEVRIAHVHKPTSTWSNPTSVSSDSHVYALKADPRTTYLNPSVAHGGSAASFDPYTSLTSFIYNAHVSSRLRNTHTKRLSLSSSEYLINDEVYPFSSHLPRRHRSCRTNTVHIYIHTTCAAPFANRAMHTHLCSRGDPELRRGELGMLRFMHTRGDES